jgi:HPr kinase/phosphorylase
MSTEKQTTLHGTAVFLRGGNHPPSAVLFRGLSGSGKSDLALRLIDKGATLISDDQVFCEKRQDKIYVSAIENTRGLIEVRGVGLFHYMAEEKPHTLSLVIDLVRREDVPRMPEEQTVDILGIDIPLFKLHAFDASAPLKVVKAMEAVFDPDLTVT